MTRMAMRPIDDRLKALNSALKGKTVKRVELVDDSINIVTEPDKKEDATAPWNRYMRPLSPEERKANGVSRPAALERSDLEIGTVAHNSRAAKDSLDQAIASVKSYLHALAQAKEEALKAALPFKSSPTLQPGDVVDMWHEGTRKFYRVLVEFQVTEEEANGV